jgi:RNA polymerase sigma factor (sigma-70 family)
MAEHHYKEEEIAQHISEGDEDAFVFFYNAYRITLYIFTNKLIRNNEVAKDIVSEAFTKAWKLRGNFKTLPDIRAFMYVVCKHAAFDYLKYGSGFKNKKEVSLEEVDEFIHDDSKENNILSQLIRGELIRDIHNEISKLPDQRRQVLELFFIKGYDTDEVAEALEINSSLVRTIKSKAIAQLRQQINSPKLLLILSYLVAHR